MAITASEITTANTLEQLRGEFNNLVTDVTGLESGTATFTAISATTSTATTVNVAEDGTIVFEGATNDEYETTLTVTDPTADRTITLPNATGTVALTSGVVTLTDTTEASATGTAALTVAGGLGVAKDVWIGDDLVLDSDGAIINFGDNQDVTLTHVHDTGLLLNTTMALQFYDATQYINAPSATVLDINATDEIELNATLADVNANLDVSGTYQGGGLMTTGGNIVIPDAGTIGSASSTSAITVASTGIVTFVDDILIKDTGTIGNASVAAVMTLASTGIVTFVDDILLKDAATIGNASVANVMTLASTGIVTFVDDIVIKDGGTIGTGTTAGAITIAAAGVVTLSSDMVVGALLKMTTNTAGYLLVGDGTSYEEVAVSGDVTMASGGAVTIAANAVEGSMLNTDTISAQTALTSGLETTDELLVSDAGTLKRMDVSVLSTLTDGNATALAIALG